MNIDETSSERLAILRFPLIVGVVFIHAYGSQVIFTGTQSGSNTTGIISFYVQSIISQGVARLSVPLFFLISGYFFFLGLNWSLNCYKKQINKRLSSLFVPFLIWNTITLLAFIVIQELPLTASLLSGEKDNILSFGILDFFDAIIGITKSPISYQFWFIRDLIVICIFSPILYFLVRKMKYVAVMLFVILWFIECWPLYVPSIASVLFFSLGAAFSINNCSLFKLDKLGKIAIFVYLLILPADVFSKKLWFNGYIHKFGILVGLIAILYLSGCLQKNEKLKKSLLYLSPSSFFVFAFHEPILMASKKISYKLFNPTSDLEIILIFLLCPTLIILLSVIIYSLMKIKFPKITSVICGGR